MTPHRASGRPSGVTVVELVVVCAIVAVLSAVALPVARFSFRRQKELQLKESLRNITSAIDRYQELKRQGIVKGQTALMQDTYPKSLDDLTKSVELVDGKKIVLLRKSALVDPITGLADWRTISSSDDPGSSDTDGANVFDIRSKSEKLSLDGKTHYSEW